MKGYRMSEVVYKQDCENVDWNEMREVLIADDFHNGRTNEQYKTSFANSSSVVIAYADGRIIGTARVLSDGVCNAYVVDVWTLSKFRNQGIASQMMQLLTENLHGQHVYLQSDDAVDFYYKLGYQDQPKGLSRIIGEWLVNKP